MLLKKAQYPSMNSNGIDVMELRLTIEHVEKDPALGHYTLVE